MNQYDYLIIGGGIAGVSAAETIRARDPKGTIGVLSGEPYLLYSRVLLPAYLKKKIRREQLFLRTADDFTTRQIDIITEERASSVHPETHTVICTDGKTFIYRTLLVASGGSVTPWDNDKDHPHIYRLQTINDADRLLAALPAIREPIVIGSSFIALEFLEIFLAHGVHPVLVSRSPYFFSSMLDEKGGAIITDNLARHGVSCRFHDAVATINTGDRTLAITTILGDALESDALAVGVGIIRNTEFIKNAGVALGEKGIRVNEFLEASTPGIFAAGDVAEWYDTLGATHRAIGNWTNAVLQGQCAGLNMSGGRTAFTHVPTYSITNLGFQITALGECDAAMDGVARYDNTKNQYERFFIRDGLLVGAFLINCFGDKAHLAHLIGQRINILQYRERLQDTTFDIHSIPLI